MSDFMSLSGDALVDPLIIEISGLLQRLIEYGEEGSIDLLGLPLTPSCVALLEQRLGRGEVAVVLQACGQSEIHETKFPGVWWTKHADEAGRVVAILIEVACVPAILRADLNDMKEGFRCMQTFTHTYPGEERNTA